MNKFILLISMLLMPFNFSYAEDASHDQDRSELKLILGDLESGLNSMNMPAIMAHLDDQVQVTFMTTEVASGKPAIEAYYAKMFKMPDAPLKSYHTQATLDAPAVFFADTAIAHGRTRDAFEFNDGTVYNFDTRWTASAIKTKGEWKVIAINFSINPFDNVVIDTMKNKIWQYSVVALLVGLFGGLVFGRLLKKNG